MCKEERDREEGGKAWEKKEEVTVSLQINSNKGSHEMRSQVILKMHLRRVDYYIIKFVTLCD